MNAPGFEDVLGEYALGLVDEAGRESDGGEGDRQHHPHASTALPYIGPAGNSCSRDSAGILPPGDSAVPVTGSPVVSKVSWPSPPGRPVGADNSVIPADLLSPAGSRGS